MRINSKILIVLLICLLFVSLLVEPKQNGFHCNDISIKEPFLELEISIARLLLFSILIPVIVIVLTETLIIGGNKSDVRSRIAQNIKVFNFGILSNFLIVMLAKNVFGRLRPHAIQFCNASHYCPEGVNNIFIDRFECHNEEYPYLLKNVRHSFYSGHASIGVYSGVYLILYLRSKYWPKIKLMKYLSTIIYIIIAMICLYPGFTQWYNYWHFASDVATGYVIGFLSALLMFKLFNCDINSENISFGNNYIPLQKLLTTT